MGNMPVGANIPLAQVPADFEYIAQTVVPEDSSTITRGIYWRRSGANPRVGVHLMHPRLDQSLNYNILPLVEAGYAVLGRGGRWPNNDIETTHEHLLLDVAAGVRRLRELGCEQVVLVGNSGGAGLATFYQAQARTEPPGRLTATPAGDPIDLNRYDMPAADGIALIGCHPGEGVLMRRWLDPSMVDEADPFLTDSALDMYDAGNGFRIPPEPSAYDQHFLTSFHAAKEGRAQRLEELARTRAARRREARRRAEEMTGRNEALAQHFRRIAEFPDHLRIVRALAWPAWVDPSIEPEEGRDVCLYNNHLRPDLENYRTFHAAYLTPEAYLSTWSGMSGRAQTRARLAEIPDPLIIVHYAADGVCHIKDAREMFQASPAKDKQFVLVPATDHYGFKVLGPHERGPRNFEGVHAIVDWMKKRFPPN